MRGLATTSITLVSCERGKKRSKFTAGKENKPDGLERLGWLGKGCETVSAVGNVNINVNQRLET